ncbi:MAG: hypothetical protein E6J11_00145 [Chloroflexi bacterium]|nr:MAG: hypothetical protein E6J11_00145 [Chloroflexota bacterium]
MSFAEENHEDIPLSISMPAEQLVLLQQFIQPKDGYIVRVETIGGKVIYAMKVFTTGTFNLCPCEVCDLQREEPARSPAANTLGYCPAVPPDDVKSWWADLRHLLQKRERR